MSFPANAFAMCSSVEPGAQELMSHPSPNPDATCVVTGASAGIGAELARELAARKYNLTLVARRADRLAALADELRSRHGIVATAISVDLQDVGERERLVAQIAAGGRHIDVLINNAGLGGSGPFAGASRERAAQMIETNIAALVDLTRLVVEPMIERRSGAILNVASTAAFQPIPNEAVYAASKAFVLSFTDALAAELAGTGVSATSLCPGPTKSEFATVAGSERLFASVPGFLVADARPVAAAGIEAMLAGKRVCVPGLANRIGAIAASKSPRGLVLRAMKLAWPAA
jgi:hypothetical protein